MTRSRSRLRAGILWAALAASLLPVGSPFGVIGAPHAQAQNIGQRTVLGQVVDSSSAAVSGATVFLKNLKTKSIRSYTTQSDGRFRFTQVNMADDQELWAEKDNRKSPTKSVSPWDSRKQFECELKLK